VPDGLLARHFLRRFLENDLVSPHADRRDSLATFAAGVITGGLFITVLLALKYQFMLQPPGHTAIFALDDRFLFIASSMLLMALLAVSQWDALALDARDASILGPLPLDHRAIVTAKLAAVGALALGAAVGINIAPSLLHPWMLAGRLPVGLGGLLALMLAHLGITVAAGVFGFVVVLGIREVTYAGLGGRWFLRASPFVQALLVVILASALLLVPSLSSGIGRGWLGAPSAAWIPPLWFLGLHEVVAGDVIAGLRPMDLRGPIAGLEREAMALYRSFDGIFRDLALIAVRALALAVVTALTAYLWNSRRLPVAAYQTHARGRTAARVLRAAAERTIVRHEVARAGFFFTFKCLARSAPHRLSIAMALGAGTAAAAVSLREGGYRVGMHIGSLPLAVLAIQSMLVIVLAAGFRHAARVPAELRANWTFHVCWSGDERPFLSGARRAAALGLILPILLGLAPLHAIVLGWRAALVHLSVGMLLALALIRLLFLGFRKLPFASSYVPSVNLKALSPIYVLVFLLASYGLAAIERAALGHTTRSLVLVLALAGTVVLVAAVDDRQRRARQPIDLDEAPAPATQRLGLGQ
jgi:hypothetical protein